MQSGDWSSQNDLSFPSTKNEGVSARRLDHLPVFFPKQSGARPRHRGQGKFFVVVEEGLLLFPIFFYSKVAERVFRLLGEGHVLSRLLYP